MQMKMINQHTCELFVNLPTIKQWDFTYENNMVKSKALMDCLETSDSIQYYQHCIEILDGMLLDATDEVANVTLKNKLLSSSLLIFQRYMNIYQYLLIQKHLRHCRTLACGA